jgi:hypothetical protein
MQTGCSLGGSVSPQIFQDCKVTEECQFLTSVGGILVELNM